MLRLEATWHEPRKRGVRRTSSGYIEVHLGGDSEGLTELRNCVVEAADNGRAHLDVEGTEESQRVWVFLGITGLQALTATTGVLLYGDDQALRDVLRGIDYCPQNGARDAPLDGYHHHIELFDERDASSTDRAGELTIYWVA